MLTTFQTAEYHLKYPGSGICVVFDFMLDTEASDQRGNFCVSFTFLKSRKVCSVFIEWLAHVDLIGTGRLLQIRSLFIPHEDLLEFQQKK